jgi:uncharacterized protein (DUF2147 family)
MGRFGGLEPVVVTQRTIRTSALRSAAQRPDQNPFLRLGTIVIGLVLLAGMLGAPGRARADQPSVPGPIGYWTLEKNAGVVQIYSCGWQTLCGALVGIEFDRPTDPMPVTWNGRSQCDYVLIADLRPSGDAWVGRITNPKNGHSYGARVSLASPGVLKLRGYFIFSALGQTQTWTRYPGVPPAGCRMSPADFNATAEP